MLGFWSSGTPTSSWGRVRQTWVGKTPEFASCFVCTYLSQEDSTSLSKWPPIPSSAVSNCTCHTATETYGLYLFIFFKWFRFMNSPFFFASCWGRSLLTFPSGNKPVHKINIIKKGNHIQMSLELLCTKMSLCIQGCHPAGRLCCFGVCVPVYMCEVVKSVFGHIATCVHSVIKASGVIKTQTRRPYNLVVTNTSVKMFIILVWRGESVQYAPATIKKTHHDAHK